MREPARGAIFDVDGTLIDSTYQHAIAWHRALRQVGLEASLWRIHRLIGMGGDKLVTELCGEVVEKRLGDTLRTLHDEAFDGLRGEITPLPGARALLEVLHGHGWRIAVASSGSASDTDWAIDLTEIGHLLACVVTADDVQGTKPDPDVFAVARSRLDVDLAVVVGDSVHDVHAAQATDTPCIGLRAGGFGHEELMSAGAVCVRADLTELLDLDWEHLLVDA